MQIATLNAEVLRAIHIWTRPPRRIATFQSPQYKHTSVPRILFNRPGLASSRRPFTLTLSCFVKGESARLDYTSKRREEGLGLISTKSVCKRLNH